MRSDKYYRKKQHIEESDDEDDVDETIDRNALNDAEEDFELDQSQEEIDDNPIDDDNDLVSSEEERETGKGIKRKKIKKSAFVETEALVGDEEEDEEEEHHQRHRYTRSRSIDAEEDEEDFVLNSEEEADESELLEAQQTYSRLLEERRTMPRTHADLKDETIAAEEEAHRIKSLYGRRSAEIAEKGFLPEPFLTPSVQDPKLWMVRCRPGKERLLAFDLLRKFFLLTSLKDSESQTVPFGENKVSQPRIFSVVIRESTHLKGFVYIEAFTKHDVVTFCDKIPHLWISSISLVPIPEMPDVLRMPANIVDKTSTTGNLSSIKPMSWVRVKRGKYTGDLAQVLERGEAVGGEPTARLQLVPRIYPGSFLGKNALGAPSDGFRKSGLSRDSIRKDETESPESISNHGKKVSYVPRLFNPIEAAEWARTQGIPGPTRSATPGYWLFNGEYFKDGFLEKEIKLTGVELLTSLPSLEELELFNNAQSSLNASGSSSLVESIIASTMAGNVLESVIPVSSIVEVTEGELCNQFGRVMEVIPSDDGEILVLNTAEFQPQLQNGITQVATRLSVPAKIVRKVFRLGDQVKVIRGIAKDTVGLVTHITGPRVIIFDDERKKEVEVLGRDLVPSTATIEIFGSVPRAETFAIDDLVIIISSGIAAVVISYAVTTGYTVLDARDNMLHGLKEASLRKATMMSNTNSPSALGASGHPLGPWAPVRIQHGPFQGCTGKVLHAFRSNVWVRLSSSTDLERPREQRGLIALRSSSVALLGPRGELLPSMGSGSNLQMNNAHTQKSLSSGHFRNKTVVILQGVYKSLTGMVKETCRQGSGDLFVELHTTSNLVRIPSSAVRLVTTDHESELGVKPSNLFHPRMASPAISHPGFATPGGLERQGWRTPGGYATPSTSSGFRTPAAMSFELGSKTPGYRTPAAVSHHIGGADGWRTPASGGFLGGSTTPRVTSISGGSVPGGSSSPWAGSVSGGAVSPWRTTSTPVGGSTSPWGSTPIGGPSSPWTSTPVGENASPWNTGSGTSQLIPSSGSTTSPWSSFGGVSFNSNHHPGTFDPSWARPNLEVIVMKSVNDTQTSIHPRKAVITGFESKENLIPVEIIEDVSTSMATNSAHIALDTSTSEYGQGSRLRIAAENLILVRPAKKDHVVVLQGDNTGTTGILVGIDGADAIVRVDSGSTKNASGFIIVPAMVVGKLVK